MGDVVEFNGLTKLPEDPASILEKAKAWDMSEVLVIGWEKDGKKVVFGGSHCDLAGHLLLLEVAKRMLIDASFT